VHGATEAPPGPIDDVEERRGLTTRAYAWWLTAIAAASLAVRVEYVAARWDNLVSLAADQYWYQNLASMITSGRGISSPTAWALNHEITPTALHGPLTSFLLVPFDVVGYSTTHEHQLLMAVLGTITVVLLAVLSGRLVGRGAGVVTGFVGALYPGLWAFDAKVMSEPVEQFLVAVILLLAYSFRYEPTAAKATGLGLAVGLSVLTRSELVLEVPLILIPLCVGALRGKDVRHIAKMSGLAVGTTALVLAPWIAYCQTAFHDPEVLSTDLGVGLIQDNNPTTYYTARIGYWWAAAETPEPGDESQRDHVYQHEAISYARAHESRLPDVVLARVGRLWDLYHPFQTASFTAPTPSCSGKPGCRVSTVEDLKAQEAWIWSFYFLIPFAIVGAVVLRRRKKIIYPMVCLAVIVTVVAIIEAGVLRFRAPFEDAFVVMVGVGLYTVSRGAVSHWKNSAGARSARTPGQS
jgi:uncharacterized membrane protein